MADFGQRHSSKPRFHVIDLRTGTTQSFLVAHGRGSDPTHSGWLTAFSNAPNSDATSQERLSDRVRPISAKHGPSRRLVGLDADNSNALSRGIVIHSAWYGQLPSNWPPAAGIGRSEGCFALLR